MSFSIGIDHGGSSIEAVAALNTLIKKHGGALWIVHNPQGSPRPTFHPKMWLFSSTNKKRLLLVGSGNLTQGGLNRNYEASLAVEAQATDQIITDAELFFDHVTDVQQPEVVLSTDTILQDLHDDGQLPSEGDLHRIASASNSFRSSNLSTKPQVPLFQGRKLPELSLKPSAAIPTSSVKIRQSVPMAPQRITQTKMKASHSKPSGAVLSSTTTPKHRFFFITVRMRQKTEVFLAKKPLDEDPAFFGAPFRGLTTPHSREIRSHKQIPHRSLASHCTQTHQYPSIITHSRCGLIHMDAAQTATFERTLLHTSRSIFLTTPWSDSNATG